MKGVDREGLMAFSFSPFSVFSSTFLFHPIFCLSTKYGLERRDDRHHPEESVCNPALPPIHSAPCFLTYRDAGMTGLHALIQWDQCIRPATPTRLCIYD